MKLRALNHTINIIQGTGFIPYPYYDINYSTSTIVVGHNIPIDGEDVDKELLNSIVLKGSIKILSHYFTGLGSNSDPVYEWLLSKINIMKEVK